MGTKVVTVRALPRAGFKAFFRGGHRWPSDMPGRTVRVTDELLTILRAESYLAVGLPDEGVEPEDGVLQYIDNRGDDRAHNALAKAREENAEMQARLRLRDVHLENERLKRAMQRSEEEAALRAENDRLKHEKELADLAAENNRLKEELALKPSKKGSGDK